MGILSDIRYDNARDVALRLQHTVVLYKDRPVMVAQNWQTPVGGDNDLLLDCYDILTGKFLPMKVHSSDEDLVVKALPLGYYNGPVEASFFVRQPCRRQKQGLSTENCFFYSYRDRTLGERDFNNVSQDLLRSKAFGEMIVGTYPTIAQCIKGLSDKSKRSMAFSRYYCIRRDEIGQFKLHHRRATIGVYNRKREEFAIPEEFHNRDHILKRYDVPFFLGEL